jgi:hypothetical protein
VSGRCVRRNAQPPPEQLPEAAYCANPVRLAGRIDHAHKRTGEVREAYSTEHEPGGVLLKACGNRRNRAGTVRYVDPTGRERAESFTRRKDAERYPTEVQAAGFRARDGIQTEHGRLKTRPRRRNRVAPCALSCGYGGVEVRGFEPLTSSVRERIRW